jgi:hypothetical protein
MNFLRANNFFKHHELAFGMQNSALFQRTSVVLRDLRAAAVVLGLPWVRHSVMHLENLCIHKTPLFKKSKNT